MGRELTDDALRDEMVRLFGVKRTTSLLGWAAIFVWAGAQDARGARSVRFGGQTARYRAVADLVRLAEYLRAAGYDLGQREVTPATARGLVAEMLPG